ncbi:unnamed protein product [Caenorhabditis auriculariae]|uniref:Uncharacterized protein n=1 Tax=Caenorhabditis auriculariae TaxID=2777116 RepID=A0A8S1H9B1_9PELO|nr:unnamed protein product [Caenorhabditis auriculariae]
MDIDELDLFEETKVEEVRYVPKIVNGGIAGIVGVTCVFPMDLVKTRLQNQTGGQRYKGIIHCFQKTWVSGGPGRINQLRNMYQGASVNILLITPEKAIKLVANDFFRRQLLRDHAERLSMGRGMLAGACAGLFQVAITTPMELLKIRMQGSSKHKKALDLVRDLLRSDGGIFSLYRGLLPTMARDVSFSALYFPLFAYLDSLGPRKKDESGDAVFWTSFFSGLVAGATASFCVTPLDVIKTRIQYGKTNYKNMIDAFFTLLRSEGPRAFFKGAVCRMMVMAPLFGIAQTVYYIGVAEYLMGYEKSSRSCRQINILFFYWRRKYGFGFDSGSPQIWFHHPGQDSDQLQERKKLKKNGRRKDLSTFSRAITKFSPFFRMRSSFFRLNLK